MGVIPPQTSTESWTAGFTAGSLRTRHEAGSARQCLFNSASHMHLWAQWVPWPLALHTAEREAGISNFTSTNGNAGVFLFIFFKPGSKAFYNCSPAFNTATWRETSFKSLSVSYVCLFFWAGLLVKPSAVTTGCFPEAFQREKRESIEVWVRDDSSVTAVTWPTSSEEKVWTLILQAYRNEHLLTLSHSSCCQMVDSHSQSASGNREKPPDIPNSDESVPNDQVTEVSVRSTNVRRFLLMYFWSKWNKLTYLLLI